MEDILFSHYHPYLAEGDLAGWQQALTELEKTSATTIVPGHGPVSSVSDLRDMQEYLRVFDSTSTVRKTMLLIINDLRRRQMVLALHFRPPGFSVHSFSLKVGGTATPAAMSALWAWPSS